MNKEYYILDPAGNITALVVGTKDTADLKAAALNVMENEPSVEQVGFTEFDNGGVSLTMSGGEFCGNAVMCAAALAFRRKGNNKTEIPVLFRPFNDRFYVSVSETGGAYTCECRFKLPPDISDFEFAAGGRRYVFPLVSFNGIKHIIADNTLSEEAAREVIKPLSGELNTPALGIMIYNDLDNSLIPFVYVKRTGTLFRENSCASGSCALAAALPGFKNKTDIKEPGGIICAQRTAGGIYLKTNVKIIKECNGE